MISIDEKFDWFKKDDSPIIISGPCSAETEAQVMETCSKLSKYKVDMLRAGIWKPRTRPNTFEGVGKVGLKWLKNAGKENNLPVTVEVANAKHVEEALEAGIDILWLGARTTVSPFAVQEIADALQGVDIPVMVKNPVNPDLQLWLGALERLNKAGITKLGAVHRGFTSYGDSKYRNKPHWQIPIELKRLAPSIKLICDPSHISGNRDYLKTIAQKAMDLNFDGLMLESHRDPSVALSDKAQQLTPDNLGELVNGLILRKEKTENEEFNSQLEFFRHKIDKMDDELMHILQQRFSLSEKIGKYKKDNEITILQQNRWDEIVNRSVENGKGLGLTEEFVQELFQNIHQESIRKQTKVMNEG